MVPHILYRPPGWIGTATLGMHLDCAGPVRLQARIGSQGPEPALNCIVPLLKRGTWRVSRRDQNNIDAAAGSPALSNGIACIRQPDDQRQQRDQRPEANIAGARLG